ncbi:MAG: DNA adenine methylase, partial [Caulobacterales bacterium]|nr:DNA adenine methylase [Caulobacterales bacterium]
MADGQVRFEFAEQRSASVRAATAWAPYRPVQYLGNKLRALDAISDAVRSMLRGRNGHVVDLFAGTTVVSQRLALDGHRVTATDVQRYSATFASALLGIGRRPYEVVDPKPIARECLRLIHELPDEWALVAQQEQRLIKASEHALLAELAATAPMIWRDPTASNYQRIATKHREVVSAETPLIASIYGGSYFGFTQAITIDLLRKAVRRLEAVGLLSIWQTAAAITAIMSAASAAAHSAGKHFAQPLSSGPKKNTAFLAKRLLEDRRVSIGERFRESVQRINENPITGDTHRALVMTAEDFVGSADSVVDVYYLDPPYTAQQYSRF